MKATALVHHGDNLSLMRAMERASVDLVFTSPPYEAARTYGIDFNLKGQDWVDWCVERYIECLRVCRGLVAWVVEGQTRQYRYSAAPALLMADLHRRGVHFRKPPVFHRVGIPGSGGPDWLRNDWEWIVCATNGGKLPWSDNTAMGHPPKCGPGGEMSYRQSDGTRRNQWGQSEGQAGKRLGTGQNLKGGCESPMPTLANPGNVIKCIVGGGVMGSDLAHENEAPFPESLAEFFVRSFCPPGGTVLDPHCGSGTTLAVALKHGRNAIGVDVRESQVALSRARIGEVTGLFVGSGAEGGRCDGKE